MEASKQLAAGTLLNYGLSYEQQQSRRPWREDRLVIKTGAPPDHPQEPHGRYGH